ncbi:unnamed protein product [Amoebophrya sp. A120]|nr:unnamed protein product [Amoebophrya sp. A120]|eukprot:GSA120T00014807001.1
MQDLIAGLKGIKSIQDVVDVVKDVAEEVAYDKTPLEKKLHEATSNQNWNVSNTLKYSLSDATRSGHDFRVIMQHIWECIHPAKGRKWRQVFKALTLLEFLVKNGADRCTDDVRDNQFKIRQLSSFSHIEEGKDRGQGVRDLSSIILQLVNDQTVLQEERGKAKESRQRTQGIANNTISSDRGSGRYGGFGSDSVNRGTNGFDSGNKSGSKEDRRRQNETTASIDDDFDPNRKIASGGKVSTDFVSTDTSGKVGVKTNRIAGKKQENKPTGSLLDEDLLGGGGAGANPGFADNDFGGFSAAAGNQAPTSNNMDDFFASTGTTNAISGGTTSTGSKGFTPTNDGFGDFNSTPAGTADNGFGAFTTSSSVNATTNSSDFGSFSTSTAPVSFPSSAGDGLMSAGGLLDLMAPSPVGGPVASNGGFGNTMSTASSKKSSPATAQNNNSNPLLDLVDFDMPSTTSASKTSGSPKTSSTATSATTAAPIISGAGGAAAVQQPASYTGAAAAPPVGTINSKPTPGNFGALSGPPAAAPNINNMPGMMNNPMGGGAGGMMGGGMSMMNPMAGGGNMNMMGGMGMMNPMMQQQNPMMMQAGGGVQHGMMNNNPMMMQQQNPMMQMQNGGGGGFPMNNNFQNPMMNMNNMSAPAASAGNGFGNFSKGNTGNSLDPFAGF